MDDVLVLVLELLLAVLMILWYYDIIFCSILTHDVFSSLSLAGDWELMHESLSVSCIIKHNPFIGKSQRDVMHKIFVQQ